MDRSVLHVVAIKQDYQAGCIVMTKPKIFKFVWYAMHMRKCFIILVTSNLKYSVLALHVYDVITILNMLIMYINHYTV